MNLIHFSRIFPELNHPSIGISLWHMETNGNNAAAVPHLRGSVGTLRDATRVVHGIREIRGPGDHLRGQEKNVENGHRNS